MKQRKTVIFFNAEEIQEMVETKKEQCNIKIGKAQKLDGQAIGGNKMRAEY